MFAALRIGLTGLRANQRYLDVIGNNLTNSETVGFKADRLTFSDVLYSTTRQPTGPSNSAGGVNGRQFGFGVQIGSVDRIDRQGSLLDTGRTFDLALQGNGFFVVNNGTEDLYTRVGSFALDREANLVDSRTGARVQNIGGSDIVLDTDAVAASVATTQIGFAGNLPAEKTGPLAERQESATAYEEHLTAVLTASGPGTPAATAGQSLTLSIDNAAPVTLTFGTPATLTDVVNEINTYISTNNIDPAIVASVNGGNLELTTNSSGNAARVSISGTALANLGFGATTSAVGSEAAANLATRLNDLNANNTDYVAGDQIQISGVNSQGQTVNATFTYGAANDGETLNDLVNSIQAQYPDTTISLDNSGKLRIDSNNTGENPLAVVLQDDVSNVGSSIFSAHSLETVIDGSGPDTRATSITVFDSLGIAHTLSGQFVRQDDDTWNLDLSVPSTEGTVTGSPISQITFGPGGTFQGASLPQITVAWSNTAAAQTVDLDFGVVGNLSGLTQFGSESSAQASSQDGFESGTLASIGVTGDGTVQGFYTNGAIIDLDVVAVAQFRNSAGLVREGSTLFRRSDNSGVPVIGQAGISGAGGIVSGSLESSNVDTAEEFVRLIEAQRSFQGSARIVTTADEIFAELLQIV